MYEPKPEDEILIFHTHKFSISKRDEKAVSEHLIKTNGEFSELEVNSSAPDRIFVVGPKGTIDAIQEICTKLDIDSFEMVVDFAASGDNTEEYVSEWYFNEGNIWVKILDERDVTAAFRITKYLSWFMECQEKLHITEISISKEALKENETCWGGDTLIAWGEENIGQDWSQVFAGANFLKITYDELLSIKNAEENQEDIKYIIEANTTEGIKNYLAVDIMFLGDYEVWCKDNLGKLIIQ